MDGADLLTDTCPSARGAQDRTCVFVAHRLSTVRHCDNIIVMKDGRVAEQGTHEELLRADGVYSDMWRMQLEEEPLLSGDEGGDGGEEGGAGALRISGGLDEEILPARR